MYFTFFLKIVTSFYAFTIFHHYHHRYYQYHNIIIHYEQNNFTALVHCIGGVNIAVYGMFDVWLIFALWAFGQIFLSGRRR